MLWSSKQPSIINGVTTPVMPAEAVMAKQAEPTSEGAQVSDMSQTLIPPWGKGDMYGPGQGKMPRDEDVAGLKEFIPCYCKCKGAGVPDPGDATACGSDMLTFRT
jgi:hypothetical protein